MESHGEYQAMKQEQPKLLGSETGASLENKYQKLKNKYLDMFNGEEV